METVKARRSDLRKLYQTCRINSRHAVIINPCLTHSIPVRIKRDGRRLMELALALDFAADGHVLTKA